MLRECVPGDADRSPGQRVKTHPEPVRFCRSNAALYQTAKLGCLRDGSDVRVVGRWDVTLLARLAESAISGLTPSGWPRRKSRDTLEAVAEIESV